MTMLGVRLGNLNMNGAPDVDGDRFVIADVDGLGSAKVEYKRTDHFGDGGSVDQIRLPNREMNIKGIAYPAPGSTNGLLRIRNKIEDAFAPTVLGLQTVYYDLPSPGRSVQLDVRAGGELHLPTPRATTQSFEIPVTAEDPRKYSQTLNTLDLSTSATLTNAGNYPTFVFGAMLETTPSGGQWPFLKNATTNLQLSFSGPQAVNTFADFASRRTGSPNGFLELTSRPGRAWWTLIPGANSVIVSGSWRLTWRDAWA